MTLNYRGYNSSIPLNRRVVYFKTSVSRGKMFAIKHFELIPYFTFETQIFSQGKQK